MSEQKKHITYSLTDIERYLQGKLSPAEMHELEKAALQDPFLAEAIEGYESADLLYAKKNLAEIETLLLQEKREEPKTVPIFSQQNNWWKIAAAIILFAGAGTIGWYLLNNEPVKNETAQTVVLPAKKDTLTQSLAVTTQSANTKQHPVLTIRDLQKENKAAASELYASELAKKMESQKNKESQFAMQLPASHLRDQASLPPPTKVAADSFFNDAGILNKEAVISARSNRSDLTVSNSLTLNNSNNVTALSNLSALTVSGNTTGRFGASMRKSMNTFSGRVVNAYNYQPIPNTVITIPKTNRGVVTDANGYFTFSSPDSIQKIQISSIGFEQKDLFAKASISNEIVMKPATDALEEVVVIGHGTSRKKDISGSVSIPQTESPKVTNRSLESTIAGIRVEQNKPAQIRGASSYTNNNLLYVIDGVPTYNTSKLNPNSIEKVEIIKDSAAASIYGASGSAGVVLVTTTKSMKQNQVAKDITIPEGGWASFMKYLKKKINTPDEKNAASLPHGAVTVSLTLKDGKVMNAEILQTFNPSFNTILIQALTEGPDWTSSLLPGETGKRSIIIVL
jgi:TonB-dependent SusC/RagA subfamily outer membrane receptor